MRREKNAWPRDNAMTIATAIAFAGDGKISDFS